MIKQNILNKEKVSKAVSRLYSVQALFQLEAVNLSIEEVQLEFSVYRDKENIEFNNFTSNIYHAFNLTLHQFGDYVQLPFTLLIEPDI